MGHPATLAKTATAMLRSCAHILAEEGEGGRERDGAGGNGNDVQCLVSHGRDREGGGGETVMDEGGCHDARIGEGGLSSPELVTPVA